MLSPLFCQRRDMRNSSHQQHNTPRLKPCLQLILFGFLEKSYKKNNCKLFILKLPILYLHFHNISPHNLHGLGVQHVASALSVRTEPYLCHLLLSLGLGGLCVGIVIHLYEDQVVGLWVDDKLGGVYCRGKATWLKTAPSFSKARILRGRQRQYNKILMALTGT